MPRAPDLEAPNGTELGGTELGGTELGGTELGGTELGAVLDRLWRIVQARRGGDPQTSYTARLFAAGRERIVQKLGEEAVETVIAGLADRPAALVTESADLLYHLLVLWAEAGIAPAAVAAELARREGRSGIEEKRARPGTY